MRHSLRIIWKWICLPFYCDFRTVFSIVGLLRIQVSIAPANIDIGTVFFFISQQYDCRWSLRANCSNVRPLFNAAHHIRAYTRLPCVALSHTYFAVPNAMNLLRLIEVSFISHFCCLRDRFVIRHYYSYREFRLSHTIISFAILRRKWIVRKERASLWSRTTMAFNANGILFVFNVLRLHSDSGRREHELRIL